MISVGWAVVLICLLAGGALFFSVNNIALRIFSRARLLDAFRAVGKAKPPEDIVEKLIENAERLVLTCALYRIIFNMCIILLLLAVFAGADSQVPQLGDYLLTFFVSVVLFSIFSLAIPHAWAKYSGEKILSRTYRVLLFFATLAWPALYVFQLYDGFVRRLAGITETTPDQQQEEKQEEFLTELEQHRMEGAVDEEEQEMIENVLELTDTAAGEIMTPRTDMIAVDVNSDRQTILDTVISAGHSRVPVYQENIDNIVGLVYAKDLLSEIGAEPAEFKLRDKIRDAYFVPETKPLRTLLHEFQNQKLHIAIVLDEYGGTAGIVTLEDILEELVGEISDEYEKTHPEPINQIDPETIEVDARMYTDDLNDSFELNLPEEEDYDTIGGFVFSHLGYIPKTGETFDYLNLKFTITSAEPRKIKRIRIRKNTEK